MPGTFERTESDILTLIPSVFTEATGFEVIRYLPGKHALVDGSIKGIPAVFRVALGPREAEQQTALWAELQRIGPHMASGRHQINQGLGFAPKAGVLALAKAPGQELLPVIKATRDISHLHRLAEWLACYAAPSIKDRPSAPAYWLKQAERSSSRQPHADLFAKEQQILEVMRGLASEMAGFDWRVAITHGDFHPNNLFWDGKTLTGIDIGGSAELPIYKDMARSLVHLARREVSCSDQAAFGVDAAGIQAFKDAFDLSVFETRIALPFFLGFECLIKTERPDAPKWRIKAANALYDGYLAEVG